MKNNTRLMLAVSAIALAACAKPDLPGSNLGDTFTAERYLEAEHGGDGFNVMLVDGMRREMHQVQNDPNAVFFYAFVQARAVVY